MAKRSNENKEDSTISYFIEDANIFALWFLSRPMFYPAKGYFGMDDASPLDSWQYARVFEFLKKRFEMAGVKFPEVHSYNDLTNQDEVHLPPDAERIKDYNEKQKQEILSASAKFMRGKGGLKELEILAPVNQTIYKWIYFQPTYSQEDAVKLTAHLDAYIDQFLNNELFVYDRNYLTFEQQKQAFIERVRKMSALEKFGENFVISSEESGLAEHHDGFLFVHTLYALQKLGYIGVLRVWCERDNLYSRQKYYANIVANDKFIDEVSKSYQKENPKIIFGGFDDKHNTLKFAGKTIELSRKNKETDAVLLMKTLSKEPERYWFNDEVAGEWDIATSDEASKNKVYFAARKINEAVKMQTGIEDFIDHNTKKFRINPKYLKG